MRLPFKLSWLAAAALAVGIRGFGLWPNPPLNARSTEAKQYRGTTITIVWEAGLQALDPLNFSGPKWKELTGIEVKVVEVADRRDVHQDHAGLPGRHRRL